MGRWLPSLLALLLAVLVSGLVIALAGGDPRLAFAALLDGAFASADSAAEVGVKTCPLLLTGLAVTLAFRSGIWNIGAEGQLLLGATMAAWLGSRLALPALLGVPLVLLLGAAGGAAWAVLAALLKLRRGVSEVIGTIMLNFVAAALVSYLVQGPLMEASGRYPQSDAVHEALRLPRLMAGARLHVGLLLALAAALGAWVLLFRTAAGYRMRAVGLNPAAARLAGFSVEGSALLAFALSGALAGLAGAVEVSAITYRLYERISPGYGFTAIAVALLGRLHPFGVVAAALFFGVLEAGSNSMQRVAGVSSVLVSFVQATVIFSLLVFEARSRAIGGGG